MFWIANSSEELEAIFEVEALFIDLAIENPVDAEKFEKDFRDSLENDFELSSFGAIMIKGQEHFSKRSNGVETFFFFFQVFSKLLDTSFISRKDSIQVKCRHIGKCESNHGSAIIFYDIFIGLDVSFGRFW